MKLLKLITCLMFLGGPAAYAAADTSLSDRDGEKRPVSSPGLAQAFMALGDLYRDGSIRPEAGAEIEAYYLKRAESSGAIFSVIQPAKLAHVEEGISPPDLPRAQAAYKLSAEFGNPDAYLELAEILLSQNPGASEALELVRKADGLGSRDATVQLGIMLIRGIGGEQDVEGGLQLLKEAATANNLRALVELATIYRQGLTGVFAPDPERAYEIFGKAVDLGSASATVIVAQMTILGEGVTPDPQKGLQIVRRLATEQEPSALVLLGDLYAKGVTGFLPKDAEKAQEAYGKAAELGSQTALIRKAEALLEGAGVDRDVQSGLEMLELAAASGNAQASLKLAEHYSELARTGGDANIRTAYQYAQAASQAGNIQGRLLSAELALEHDVLGIGSERLLAELLALETAGDARASLLLGDYYSGRVSQGTASNPEKAFNHYQRAAEYGSKSGLLRLALMQIRGTAPEGDRQSGYDTLKTLADAGDPSALVSLGDALATAPDAQKHFGGAEEAYKTAVSLGSRYALLRLGDLYRLKSPADTERFELLYREAAGEAGSSSVTAEPRVLETDPGARASAYTRLGDLYFEGRAKPYEPAVAARYYSRADQLGNEKARVRLAELAVRGQVGWLDPAEGFDRLQQLAAQGNVRALVSLGDVHARGYGGRVDVPLALSSYKAAAAKDDISAMLRLADIYRFGLFAPKDTARAFHYLQEAAAAGSDYARVTLVQAQMLGEIGKTGSQAARRELLVQSVENGSSEAAVFLAMMPRDANAVPQSVAARLGTLQSLAQEGNAAAALRLVAIYRDGYTWAGGGVTRKNPSRARQILAENAETLSSGTLAREQFLLDALSSPRKQYPALYQRLQDIVPADRPAIMRRVLRANPNAFLYFTQRLLAEDGYFKAKPNGQLTGQTIRAINRFCSNLGARNLCRNGPLSIPTTQLLSHAFDKYPHQAKQEVQLRSSRFSF